MAAWRKVGYCYPSGLEKTLHKWDIYVPLVTKGLRKTNEKYFIFISRRMDFPFFNTTYASVPLLKKVIKTRLQNHLN